MNIRKHITLAVAPLCLVATLSVADSNSAAQQPAALAPAALAMNACVKAFVSMAVPKDRQLAVQTESYAGSSILMRKRPYAIALTATSSTGKQLATATCRTDREGTVVALNGKPMPSLTAQDANASLTSAIK